LTAKLFYLLRCIFELPEATSYYIISKLFFSKKNRQRDPVAWIAAKIVQLKIYEPIKLPSV
jgi:hypothetical protein